MKSKIGTTDGNNRWEQQVGTTGGNKSWEQKLGTKVGNKRWEQNMEDFSKYSGRIPERLSFSKATRFPISVGKEVKPLFATSSS
jgi:hypothetical protein